MAAKLKNEDLSVDWNINSKQVISFAGRGLLENIAKKVEK